MAIKPRAYNPFRPEEVEEIIRLRREGWSFKRIAVKLGRSEGSVAKKIIELKNKGVDLEKKTADPGPEEEPGEAEETAPDLPDGFEMIERELSDLLRAEETLLGELGAVRERIKVIRVRLQGLLGLAGGADDVCG